MANPQEEFHGAGHDYVAGSPHLRHAKLRQRLEESLSQAVQSIVVEKGYCRVLEVGAGHGPFTPIMLSQGAAVTVTEMSEPSAAEIRQRFSADPSVRVIYDPEGSWVFETSETFDLVACISVLHHIPDYLGAVGRYVEVIDAGGAFVSWQDPLLYSTVGRRNRLALQASYYLWRLGQGDMWAGFKAFSRRLRGQYDLDDPRDLVEYHVVRDGVDESALVTLLRPAFADVALVPYWSTQLPGWQAAGDRLDWRSSFGVVASGRTT